MAVDTRRKRASLIGRGLPFRITLPPADGSIELGDRLHLLGLYSGLQAAPPATPVSVVRLTAERMGLPTIRDEGMTLATIGAESVIP